MCSSYTLVILFKVDFEEFKENFFEILCESTMERVEVDNEFGDYDEESESLDQTLSQSGGFIPISDGTRACEQQVPDLEEDPATESSGKSDGELVAKEDVESMEKNEGGWQDFKMLVE